MTRARTVPVLQVLDVVVPGVGVALLLAALVGGVTLAFGGTVTQVRERLFLVGLVALVLGAIATRPKRGNRSERGEQNDGGTDETTTPVQRYIPRLVPSVGPLAPSKRSSRGSWLLVAGALLQAVAFVPI